MTADPPVLWLVARASGLMAYAFLTLTVLLGIAAGAPDRPGWSPRFLLQGLHRATSATALGLLVVHVVALVADPHAGLVWLDAVLPFNGEYKQLWTGLGTAAVDCLLFLVATSVFRSRLGPRLWRYTHITAYMAWALGLLHGLGTGTDSVHPSVTAGYAASLGLVVFAGLLRAARRPVRVRMSVVRSARVPR